MSTRWTAVKKYAQRYARSVAYGAGKHRHEAERVVGHFVGLGAVAFALGMWNLPVGIAAGGIAVLLITELRQADRKGSA